MGSFADRLVQSWGQRRALNRMLWPVSALLGLLVQARRRLYALGLVRSQSAGLPVLVVGNRIVGGAGKTPATIAIVQHLQARGWQPGVLTRGYHRDSRAPAQVLLDAQHAQLSAREVGDEPLLIWRRTQAPVMVGADRLAGARTLRKAHPEVNLLVCDDGLQHLRLQRQIEVVVFDERGAGNGWLMPAGPLREPLETPAPAGLVAPPVVLYNAVQPSTALPGHLARRQLAPWQTLQQWWQAGLGPLGEPAAVGAIEGPPAGAWAVAGLAHPHKFFAQLRALGLDIVECPCPDHESFEDLPWPLEVRHVIVTEKDAVKLDPARMAAQRPNTQVWVAALDFHPEASFWAALDTALAALPPPAIFSN